METFCVAREDLPPDFLRSPLLPGLEVARNSGFVDSTAFWAGNPVNFPHSARVGPLYDKAVSRPLPCRHTPRTPVLQRCASARGARRREQRLPDLLEHVGPVGQPDHRRQVVHNEPSLLARCPKLKHVAVHPVIPLFVPGEGSSKTLSCFLSPAR